MPARAKSPARLRASSTAAMAAAIVLLFPAQAALGHGLGLDSTQAEIQGRQVGVTVETPEHGSGEPRRLVVSAYDDKTSEPEQNVTFLITMLYAGEQVLQDRFFAPNGAVSFDIAPSKGPAVISGVQAGDLGAWQGKDGGPVAITGDAFAGAGLYTFDIRILTIGKDGGPAGDHLPLRADLSIIDEAYHMAPLPDGSSASFATKSYYDKISAFSFDPEKKAVSLEMPFDWADSSVSHVPVVHIETRFDKGFEGFFSPGYEATANGIDLFDSSVTIDDYTGEDERIIHLVLLGDHLRYLKSNMDSGQGLPETMSIEIFATDELKFPVNAVTAGEEFQIDLSWSPPEILPGEPATFIFTIRDGQTGEPLRHSSYTMVILQGGQEIHRVSGSAVVGGASESFEFGQEQGGPTVVRFEDIRGSGLETEFVLVVVPEFGAMAVIALAGASAAALVLGRVRQPA